MKNNINICAFIFLTLACLSAVEAANIRRGLEPIPVIDQEGNQVALYKESHALIVGVSEYLGGWPTLLGVKRDIEQVKQALEEHGFHTVVARDPSRKELMETLEGFINQYGQQADNRLLFYFAGHGHTLKLAFGEDMGYFVPADAPHPHQDKPGFLSKGLNMELMQVYAKQIQSKHALFLFDSCFSGSFFSLSRAVPRNISYKTSQPVRQFITSGSANEQVPDDSVFREQFIAALSGEGDLDEDGYMTGMELGEFLQKKVIIYTQGSQHPQYGKMRNPRLDKGDFVFPLKSSVGLDTSSGFVEKKNRKLETGRLRPGLEKNQSAEIQLQAEEGQNLEEGRRRPRQKNLEIAALAPKKLPAVTGHDRKCPEKMAFVGGRVFVAEKDGGALEEIDLQSFCIDKYEVTQRQFKFIMGENPSHFVGIGSHPVENVSWYQAKKYCERVGKRLPTEWEWEGSGNTKARTIYFWGDEFNPDFAWFAGNSGGRTHPVGRKTPSSNGLHDMAGNVWEWTSSGEGEVKFLRGGSWNTFANGMRVSDRRRSDPSFASSTFGFRCVQ